MASSSSLNSAAEPTAPAVDLSNCAREPIHIPGAIQPHGVLLVLQEPELTVLQASDNAETLLGARVDELLGQPVARCLGPNAGEALREMLTGERSALPIPLRVTTQGKGGTREWDAIVHRTAGGTVLELEPAAEADPRSVAGLYDRVRRALGRLQATRSLPDLCEAIAEEIQRLTGLDRVMVYRFDAEWNGEVVAEVKGEGMDGFLGLRFPASDIPAQARELYRRNWLRLIADVGYTPARVLPALNPATGAPLDLSNSTLRSVSPIHLEYLRNMEVGASMSVSLLRGGELWGLVACHHRTPKYVPYHVRTACEFLGQTFSVQLASLVDEQDRDRALHLASVSARLLDRTAARSDWVAALLEGDPPLPEVAGAEGAVVWASSTCHGSGSVPTDEQIAALVEWLAEQGADVFHTDHLAGHFPEAAAYTAVASGVLAAAIGRARGDYLLWFRPEVVRTLTWAGNPAKAVHQDGAAADNAAERQGAVPRLHPRRSFAAWSEQLRSRALPWRPAEVQAATQLRDRVVDVVLRQADELARLNAELHRSNEELEAFTYIASHDLKEPLRGIHTFAQILLADHRDALGEEGNAHAETVIRLSERMDGMLDSLLHYSRAGQLHLKMVDTDLQQLLSEVLDTLDTRLKASGMEVRVPRPLPTLCCDPVRAGSVLQNLVSNAIKYNDKPDRWVEIGYRESDGPVVLYVRDNGIGIQGQHHDVVFRLFRRLHPRDRYGGGTGAGLTIARRLVERHGGRIWLESSPGEGTTFFFTLEPAAG